MINVLNVYSSLNGQTQKVALAIEKACVAADCTVSTINARSQNEPLNLLEYDMIFSGSGVYTWLPDKHMLGFINRQLSEARTNNLIQPSSPRLTGKYACVYCTYGGPHTGEAEAVPAVKYMGQLFDHLGISIAAEWCIPGAFVPAKMRSFNTKGRLGNIEGRPNAEDLKNIYDQTLGLLSSLNFVE